MDLALAFHARSRQREREEVLSGNRIFMVFFTREWAAIFLLISILYFYLFFIALFCTGSTNPGEMKKNLKEIKARRLSAAESD